MTDRIMCEIRKNKQQVIRVTLQEYEGHPVCSVRVWFKAQGGELRPSRDGINLRPDQMAEFAEGVRAAAEAIAHQDAPKPPAPAPTSQRSHKA